MLTNQTTSIQPTTLKRDANYVFYELTRSICPTCRRPIDAKILLRGNKVYMQKRCPEHGEFEGLIYADADAYVNIAKFNKPGAIPLHYATEIENGCPHDCGLCPDHQQHACVGIIEVNSACNMDCPLCFADAGAGFNLSLADVEEILDHFVAAEGMAEVVQFSGGEPTIHPQIIPMLRAAQERNIRYVMLNTNGRHGDHDPMQRMTNPEIISLIAEQTNGLFRQSDFLPVPCCFPTCNSVTYAYIEGDSVTPLPRLLDIDDYLDYITNRALPQLDFDVKQALEGLWSSAAGTGKPHRLDCLHCRRPTPGPG